ncbi:SCO family protein [Sporosarcina limicola]|uniref:Protein SCO1/2 n=1 Tax=Sporosarcina limicola TaxID=34101 RepID=A0A927R2F6_9BACL|nr:SCO family protein [Sporosarcina limicola]MBE1553876.1 protein SCO1/2 [Sporosarcina limicola]
MQKKYLLSYVLLVILVLSACSGGGFKADHKYEIEPFEFTNQHDEQVSLNDLKGTVWLAQFVFTNCTTVCPPMMTNMTDLQQKLIDAGVEDYKIVSFSVDPAVDTPEVLQGYLDLFNIPDQSKWEMLTGYTQKEIADISLKSFKLPVIDDPNTDQVVHGVRFGLINQEGQVVKTYNGKDDVPFDQIVKDMKALIKVGS